jgi:DNA modification methylase
MPAAEAAKLCRSVQEFGMVQPVIVRTADHTIIAGHQRVEAARALGIASLPVIYLDLPKERAKVLSLALNRIAGEWDVPRLEQLLQELQDLPEVDVSLTGFDPPELDELLAGVDGDQETHDREGFDLAAELARRARGAATRVQPGETWVLGRHRLLCGDSLREGALAGLCEGQQPSIVVTDPPYGLSYESQSMRRLGAGAEIANDDTEGYREFLARALPAIRSVMGQGSVIYFFAGGGGPKPALAHAMLEVSRHFDLLNVLVWDKQSPGLNWRWRYAWEAVIEASVGKPSCWYGGNDRANVLRCPRVMPQLGGHPTPKPVPLLAEILRAASPPGSVVLDPFCGMGSTLIAAEQTGRVCMAVEIEPFYCDLILSRWESLTGQSARKEACDAE